VGQEEAAAKFGADPRVYLTTVKKFIGDANGRVKELVTVEVKWEKNEKGQFIPKEQAGTEKTIEDHVISLSSGKNCSSVRKEKGLTYCVEDEAQVKDVILEGSLIGRQAQISRRAGVINAGDQTVVML